MCRSTTNRSLSRVSQVRINDKKRNERITSSLRERERGKNNERKVERRKGMVVFFLFVLVRVVVAKLQR